MKNLLIVLIIGSFFASCQKNFDNDPQKSKIIAMEKLDGDTKSVGINQIDNNRVIFTGDDIAWFSPRTREIKFTNLTSGVFALPSRSKVEIYLDKEKLFTCIHINGTESAAYNDLVLFYDIDANKYYLNDFYPCNWFPEKVKENIEARAIGWNKFLNQLKEEKKLK